MDEPPSRNPEDYHATTHLKQRLKYRTNPPIPKWVINDAIREGYYYEHDAEIANFTIGVKLAGKLHEFKVGIDKSDMQVTTAACFCHEEGNQCRRSLIGDKYK